MKSNRSIVVIGSYFLLIVVTFLAIGSLSEDAVRIVTSGRRPGDLPSSIPGIVCMLFYVSLVATYLLPTIVAFALDRPAGFGIALINLFFGWSGIGWITAFIWACTRPAGTMTITSQSKPPPVPTTTPDVAAELATLRRLREADLITEEEYLSRRVRVLDSFG
jgi:hypothetical protein